MCLWLNVGLAFVPEDCGSFSPRYTWCPAGCAVGAGAGRGWIARTCPGIQCSQISTWLGFPHLLLDAQNQCWCQLLAQLGAGGLSPVSCCPSAPWHWCKPQPSGAGCAPLAPLSPTTAAVKEDQTSCSHWGGKPLTPGQPSAPQESWQCVFPRAFRGWDLGVLCRKGIFNSDFLPEPSSDTCEQPLEWNSLTSLLNLQVARLEARVAFCRT